MKPASRIQATIDVLEKIAANTRVPMDSVIGDYMRHRRYIGSKDRAEIAERVYHMARHTARIGWWLDKTGAQDSPRNRVITWLALGEGIDKGRTKDLFDGSKYAPEALDDKEQKRFEHLAGRSFEHPDIPPSVRVECPPLYEDTLKAYFGEDFETEMTAMLTPAPLDLRVNTFLAGKEKVINYLEADGVKVKETTLSPWGLRCEGKAYLAKTKAFGKGWIEIQDEGSQLIAHMCGAKPGQQVLDYCAGAGGKTLALGAAMQKKGRIVAMDNDARRLKKGRDRYKKAHIADIIEVRCIEEEKQRKWLKRQKGKFDVVLTDVPCTGTGTWRRNPDMRWRVFGPSLEELVEIQAEILEKVAPLVKPDGRLVYATCSLLPDENETQVERFLAAHDEFEIIPVSPTLTLPRSGGGKSCEAAREGGKFMRLTPHRHGTDGFFTAILQRR